MPEQTKAKSSLPTTHTVLIVAGALVGLGLSGLLGAPLRYILLPEVPAEERVQPHAGGHGRDGLAEPVVPGDPHEEIDVGHGGGKRTDGGQIDAEAGRVPGVQ